MFERLQPHDDAEEQPQSLSLYGAYFKHKGRKGQKGGSAKKNEPGSLMPVKPSGRVKLTTTYRGKPIVKYNDSEIRRRRALASHKSVTKEVQVTATEWERKVASLLGGVHLEQFKKGNVFDVRVGDRHLIEVRTIQSRKPGEDRMTVHAASGERKDNVALGLAEAPGIPKKKYRAWGVIIDLRDGKQDIYVKEADYKGDRWQRDSKGKILVKESAHPLYGYPVYSNQKRKSYGFGGWTITVMTKLSSFAELKKVIA